MTSASDFKGPLRVARRTFEGTARSFGDSEDAYVSRFFEGEDPFSEDVVPFDEDGSLGLPNFMSIALEVFGPLQAHLEKQP